MVLMGLKLDRMLGCALCLMAVVPLASAGDGAVDKPIPTAAPLEIPHSTNLVLDQKARKRDRKPDNVESSQLVNVAPGLKPVTWPKNSDVRPRIVTPELRSTPVVGWVAANLYRSKNDNGWCLEVDPGGGEYVVFYRLHLK